MITYLQPATRAVVAARGMPNTSREILRMISIFAPDPDRLLWLEQVDAIVSSPFAEAFAAEAENFADRELSDRWQFVGRRQQRPVFIW